MNKEKYTSFNNQQWGTNFLDTLYLTAGHIICQVILLKLLYKAPTDATLPRWGVVYDFGYSCLSDMWQLTPMLGWMK